MEGKTVTAVARKSSGRRVGIQHGRSPDPMTVLFAGEHRQEEMHCQGNYPGEIITTRPMVLRNGMNCKYNRT